jgi:hypothetical protein
MRTSPAPSSGEGARNRWSIAFLHAPSPSFNAAAGRMFQANRYALVKASSEARARFLELIRGEGGGAILGLTAFSAPAERPARSRWRRIR